MPEQTLKSLSMSVNKFNDPFGLLNPCPESIASLFLEKENPPSLSLLNKIYYHFRPLIPLTIRHILQSTRKIKVNEEWFITDRLIEEYKKYCTEEIFKSYLENIWPNRKKSPIVMTHDVESAEGLKFIPRILEVERRYQIKSSWNIVPYLYPIDNGIIRLIEDEGHEIGIHDYNHDGKLFLSKRLFDKRKGFINEALSKYNAVGFRGGATNRNIDWLQELNIQYESSCFDTDPFQPMPGGTHSIWPFCVGKFVELPYTMPQDHVLWIQLREKDNRIWRRKLEWIYRYNGMILLITHPDYLMIGNNLSLYEKLLSSLSELENTWNPLPKEIATYWEGKYRRQSGRRNYESIH